MANDAAAMLNRFADHLYAEAQHHALRVTSNESTGYEALLDAAVGAALLETAKTVTEVIEEITTEERAHD